MPAMVTGQLEFVHNVRVPGMLHGRVVRPPTVGATLARVDEGSVRAMPGVVKVVVKNNFVGVVAEKPWQAMQAADEAPGHVDARRRAPAAARRVSVAPEAAGARHAARRLRRRGRHAREAATVLRATYPHPYQMHGSVGSSCAVADVQADTATLWSATQSRTRRATPPRCCSACAGAACAWSTRAAPAATASTARTRSPTTRRCCRRRSAGRCACSCRARTRWRGRTTATCS